MTQKVPTFTLNNGVEIPAIGLDLFVRMPPAASANEFCLIETIIAPVNPASTSSSVK